MRRFGGAALITKEATSHIRAGEWLPEHSAHHAVRPDHASAFANPFSNRHGMLVVKRSQKGKRPSAADPSALHRTLRAKETRKQPLATNPSMYSSTGANLEAFSVRNPPGLVVRATFSSQ